MTILVIDMGKKLCMNCRKSFNQSLMDIDSSDLRCAECGHETILMSHRFRPPKLHDHKKWKVVQFLIDNGFPYHHISIYERDRNGINRFIAYAKYPEDMIDAVEFVEKYKDQSK